MRSRHYPRIQSWVRILSTPFSYTCAWGVQGQPTANVGLVVDNFGAPYRGPGTSESTPRGNIRHGAWHLSR
ncbi:hypothetical protein LZ30DRAFT_722988 [Colletotrichum cereale]|nr:hypothetical protein LZ30DRAFT_722988 [Colletotrichum cereale]